MTVSDSIDQSICKSCELRDHFENCGRDMTGDTEVQWKAAAAWRALAKILGVLPVLVLYGCVSGPRPISIADRVVISQALLGAFPWRLDVSIDGRPPAVLAVLFDGTRNNRAHVPKGERPTVIADIQDALNDGGKLAWRAQYYPGPGTQPSKALAFWDAMFGSTTAARAEQACVETLREIDVIRRESPNVDVRVMVAGFSRGAAAARHFMNLLARRCVAESASTDHALDVHFYALLFDTVATGQHHKLELRIPPSADQVFHFLSLDERRIFFRPIVDTSDTSPLAGRIVTIPVPGVHSDIGIGYPDGVGLQYRPLVLELLHQMGLTQNPLAIVEQDYNLQGGHDSRWPVERLLGIGPASSVGDHARQKYYLPVMPLESDRIADWQHRRSALLTDSGMFQTIIRSDHPPPAFQVRRTPDGFQLSSVPDEWGRRFYLLPKMIVHGRSACVEYHVAYGVLQSVLVPPSVLRRLRKQSVSQLEFDIIFRPNLFRMWWLVDNVISAQAPWAKLGGCGN
jgi:hypothetical protein